MPSILFIFYWKLYTQSPYFEHLVKVTGPQIGPVQFPRIWPVDRPYMGPSQPNQGTEERFYIVNDRGTLFGGREGANRELWRNPKAVSVPHLPVTVRPYILNRWEERGPWT